MKKTLSEALAETSKRRGNGQWTVLERMQAELSEGDWAEVENALLNVNINTTHLARAFTAMGFRISEGTLGQHRRRFIAEATN